MVSLNDETRISVVELGQRRMGWTIIVTVLLFFVAGPVTADINFGHVDAVEEHVDELDEKVLEQTGGSSGRCSVDYGPWLSSIESMDDLDAELLETSVDTSAPLDVINNNTFSEDDTEDSPVDHELTTDTMLQRCNTRFDDAGDTAFEHHIFCRGFRLPDGKQYDNFDDMEAEANAPPMDLNTLSFFHAGNIDDDSENWLIPFIEQYQSSCQSRTTHVILFGAYVEENGDKQFDDGNKWHLTSTDWAGTQLEDLMDQSNLVVTGHSTASCPFVDPDTRGLYVGGREEPTGRRITNRVGSNALWVGTGADKDDAEECYGGVSTDNPANASGGGIQLEYQVTTSNPASLEAIAKAIIREW